MTARKAHADRRREPWSINSTPLHHGVPTDASSIGACSLAIPVLPCDQVVDVGVTLRVTVAPNTQDLEHDCKGSPCP